MAAKAVSRNRWKRRGGRAVGSCRLTLGGEMCEVVHLASVHGHGVRQGATRSSLVPIDLTSQ